jgi:hypothetical protein
MNLEKLIEAAEDEAAECVARGDSREYSISTFGMVRSSVELSVDEMIAAICRDAPVGGRTVWLATERALTDAGFSVRRSGSEHHYDVVLGHDLRVEDVQKLVDLLEPTRRRNPAWKT